MYPLLRRQLQLSFVAVVFALCLSGVVGAVALAHANHPTTAPSPTGTWTQELQGYHVLSMVAAQSHPGILYACVLGQNAGVQVLRSNDAGLTWQNKTVTTSLRSNCEIAVSYVHADTVYGIGKQQGTLLYTNDGGKSWKSLQPKVTVPGQAQKVAWSGGQITTATGALFSVQSISVTKFSGLRLLRSSDSGKSWTVIDSHFAQTQRGERDYAVNPLNSHIIDELVGKAGSFGNLYRSTDGGSHWGNPVLTHLPHGTTVSVARLNPNVVVVAVPGQSGVQLQVATDGGVTTGSWNPVPHSTSLQGWLLAPGGLVYAITMVAAPAPGTPTPSVPAPVTPTPSVPAPMPTPCSTQPSATPTTPQSGTQPSATPTTPDSGNDNASQASSGGNPFALGSTAPVSLFAPGALQPAIVDYDPGTGQAGQWNDVIQPPAAGALLLVSPAIGSAMHTVLWFLSGNVLSRTEI